MTCIALDDSNKHNNSSLYGYLIGQSLCKVSVSATVGIQSLRSDFSGYLDSE